MPHAVAISCQGVSKSFALIDRSNAWRLLLGRRSGLQQFQALSDVSFDVPKGQFVGILGRNGAGKSTLLRVIGGVYPVDTGRIVVDGALSGLYELGLAGNTQATGRQYAERLLTIQGFDHARRQAMISDIHEFSELGDRFEDPVQTYSTGMAARLYFSAATAGHYEVYLLDEILSVGDQHFQAKCWRRLQDRVSHGASGMLVTHDWSATVKLCQTTHVLERGRIVFTGASERAARIYLYGKEATAEFRRDIASIASAPPTKMRARQGGDMRVAADVDIRQDCKVLIALVIERMQAGYGWETILMSKSAQTVGTRPGRYRVEMEVPRIPVEPGTYQISIQLGMPDPESPGRYIALDSIGWLSGNGITLEVEGPADGGQLLAAHWTVEAA